MKNMSYEEAVEAKEFVETFDFEKAFDDNEIIEKIIELPLNVRAVFASGSFNRSVGGIQFMMPSTKEVIEFDLEELENKAYTHAVRVTISESCMNATSYGFYSTESVKTISTGRFK